MCRHVKALRFAARKLRVLALPAGKSFLLAAAGLGERCLRRQTAFRDGIKSAATAVPSRCLASGKVIWDKKDRDAAIFDYALPMRGISQATIRRWRSPLH
jgi:hypothetical protein